jgi:hypothetical protein
MLVAAAFDKFSKIHKGASGDRAILHAAIATKINNGPAFEERLSVGTWEKSVKPQGKSNMQGERHTEGPFVKNHEPADDVVEALA